MGMLLMASMEKISPEDPEFHEPPSEGEPLIMWLVSITVCTLPALVGGAVAGRLARGGWLVASGLVGAWAAMQAKAFLNGPGANDQPTMVVVAMVTVFAAALVAGFVLRNKRHAAAS